jgi:predicted peptidase
MDRRKAISLLGSATVGAWLMGTNLAAAVGAASLARDDETPKLATGAPNSPERLALIEDFKKRSDGLEKKFDARIHKSDNIVMPYRLFRPETKGKEKLPLVVFLHGSGGLGTDNEKQMGLGNIFGTRVWAMPENQKAFPCYVLAPQTDRGWARYDLTETKGSAKVLPGLGESDKQVVEIIQDLTHEIAIDEHRVYVTGQSMGGAGVWNVIRYRPEIFAGAVICCGSVSDEDGTGGLSVPVWNFHGDADKTVPVSLSRTRISARRKAGGHPLSTEYAGVDHNSWQWAYTEPEMIKWLFAQRRK